LKTKCQTKQNLIANIIIGIFLCNVNFNSNYNSLHYFIYVTCAAIVLISACKNLPRKNSQTNHCLH